MQEPDENYEKTYVVGLIYTNCGRGLRPEICLGFFICLLSSIPASLLNTRLYHFILASIANSNSDLLHQLPFA